MNIVVTGGMGFIGQHLIRKLVSDGASRITIIDNLLSQVHGESSSLEVPDGCDLIVSDLGASDLYEGALSDCDLVYHLAAQTGTGQSMYQSKSYLDANVMGFSVLLESLARCHPNPSEIHIVLPSSRSVYGEGEYKSEGGLVVTPGLRTRSMFDAGEYEIKNHRGEPLIGSVPTSEFATLDPCSLYAASKLMQEYQLRYFSEMTGAATSIFRLQNVYGPGQSLCNPYTGVLGVFFNRARAGEEIFLYERGGSTRDFIHVRDVVNVLNSVATAPTGAVINLGTGKAVSISKVATNIKDAVSVDCKITRTDRFRIGDIRHACADVSLLESICDSAAFMRFEIGIQDYVAWAQAQERTEDTSELAYKEFKNAVRRAEGA